MNKFNWSEEELLAYEQMKKRIMDEVAAFAQKFDEGLRVGEERGIPIGYQKGKIEGKIEVAKNSLKAGVSIDVIAEITYLSFDEIRKLNNYI